MAARPALTLAAMMATALRLAGAVAGFRLVGRATAGLQAAIWDRLLRQPANYFHGRDPGDLGEQVIGVVDAGPVLVGGLAALTTHGPVVAFSLALLSTIDWRLGLAALALAVGSILLAGVLSQAALRVERALS